MPPRDQRQQEAQAAANTLAQPQSSTRSDAIGASHIDEYQHGSDSAITFPTEFHKGPKSSAQKQIDRLLAAISRSWNVYALAPTQQPVHLEGIPEDKEEEEDEEAEEQDQQEEIASSYAWPTEPWPHEPHDSGFGTQGFDIHMLSAMGSWHAMMACQFHYWLYVASLDANARQTGEEGPADAES